MSRLSTFFHRCRRPGDRAVVLVAAGRLRPRRRGSVLIIVMMTLVFATVALIAFMDKASNDLLVEHRDALARRLRMEAYSALEVTLAVLEDFRSTNNGLHGPSEGWNDPLTFAGYTPTEDRTVEISFEDESGKISLPHADAPLLSKLFQSWGVSPADGDMYADAMMGWMQREHVYSTGVSPDYEQLSIPYDPPARPLRSYSELAAIDKVREFFYDADGRPNDNWRKFVASVSLYNFARSNINGARPDTLTAVGQYDPTQQGAILDFTNGKGQYQNQGPQVFHDTGQAAALLGPGGNINAFTTTISALRINVTVHEGRSIFKLSAVVAPPNGARIVQETATSQRVQTSGSSGQANAQRAGAPNTSQSTANSGNNASANQNLRYPFTLLEIRENDEIPPAPPPPPENPS